MVGFIRTVFCSVLSFRISPIPFVFFHKSIPSQNSFKLGCVPLSYFSCQSSFFLQNDTIKSISASNHNWSNLSARIFYTEASKRKESSLDPDISQNETESPAIKGERLKRLRQLRKTRKWDRTIDQDINNRVTEESMEFIKSKYLDHEIWHHPSRGPLKFRPPKPDNLVCLVLPFYCYIFSEVA